jgi:hypothetical protein
LELWTADIFDKLGENIVKMIVVTS